MTVLRKLPVILAITLLTVFLGCAELAKNLVDEEAATPTETLVKGVWVVTDIADDTDTSFSVNQINFPITAFYMQDDGDIMSTAGPLWNYLVYGSGSIVSILDKIETVFDYAQYDFFTNGEFFIGDSVESRFTVEIKLQPLGSNSLDLILTALGITTPSLLKDEIYHKFRDISVSFSDDEQTMYWEFDNTTSAVYNMKDDYGDYELWNGWDTDAFSKCRITLTKQSLGLAELVEAAATGTL